MPADLIFELGCEEIPAKMLAKQLADLPTAIATKLTAARLAYGSIRVLGTPRRIAILVEGLAGEAPDLEKEVVGPLYSVAVVDGKFTKAGEGWAAKNKVALEDIVQREVPGKKGIYAIAKTHEKGAETRALLPAILVDLCATMAWPKSQRWGWSETRFVRPVQWLVAIYGNEVVNFTWAGIASGRRTRGHRFLANDWIEVDGATYVDALRAAHVIVDPEERKARVRAELARLESETGLKVRKDETLVGEVIHLGELQVGIVGGFDPAFLEIPEEIAVTTMRNNQRVFVLEHPQTRQLAPKFATMMATRVKNPAVVSAGNEKVIASRLSDGVFFFNEDKKEGFDAWNAKLDAVVFQAKLGDGKKTIGDKVRRIVAIVAKLAPGDAAALEGAKLCKADLASKAVGEFPELQGIMGKHYARAFGHSDEVGRVIEQHWWPKGAGADVPTTSASAAVALADKMDTIVGCFANGLEPSGGADPLGLRRAAIGIWQILLRHPQFTYLNVVTVALGELGVSSELQPKLDEFFKQRLRGIFLDEGMSAQDVDAALARDFLDPRDASARAHACAQISGLAREVFKRVANIIDDARKKGLAIGDAPDPAKFVHDTERGLFEAVSQARDAEQPHRANRAYSRVFESLEGLRPTVAKFFDKGGVMVMDPDPTLRDNRLALLSFFIEPYMAIADFRLLAGGDR